MQTFLILAAIVTLAQAGLTPILPPLTPRDMPLNSTRNSTTFGDEVTPYHTTVEYKVWLAFLIFGIVAAVMYLPLVFGRDLLRLCHGVKKGRQIQQRYGDVEMAQAQMRGMAEPEVAYLRPERAG